MKMCRGVREGNQEKSFCNQESATPNGTSALVCCELCGSKAMLYCQADDAYLCSKCDKWVHGANFLAQRHIRCLLCKTCQNLTQRYLVGVSHEVILPNVNLNWSERRQHHHDDGDEADDITVEDQCSKSLKMPFLFL